MERPRVIINVTRYPGSRYWFGFAWIDGAAIMVKSSHGRRDAWEILMCCIRSMGPDA